MDRQRRPMDEVFDSAEVRRRIAGTTTGGGRVTSATFRLVSTVMREDRVLRVMIVRNEMAATCVEWCDR